MVFQIPYVFPSTFTVHDISLLLASLYLKSVLCEEIIISKIAESSYNFYTFLLRRFTCATKRWLTVPGFSICPYTKYFSNYIIRRHCPSLVTDTPTLSRTWTKISVHQLRYRGPLFIRCQLMIPRI